MSVQIDAIKPGDSVLVRMRITEAGERGIFAHPASAMLSASAVHLWPEDIFSVEKAPLKVGDKVRRPDLADVGVVLALVRDRAVIDWAGGGLPYIDNHERSDADTWERLP